MKLGRAVTFFLRLSVLLTVSMHAKEQNPSDTRQAIWNIRIDRLLKEPPGWAPVDQHETQALAFSPDRQRLALTLAHQGRSQNEFRLNTHLLILEVRSPETHVQQFDLTQSCGRDLSWNQGGAAILVCSTILRTVDGASCTVSDSPRGYPSLPGSWGAYWFDPSHVVRWTGEIFDMACKQVGKWQLDPGWQIRAVAASKGWAFLVHTEWLRQLPVCQYSIVDLATHQALTGWPTGTMPLTSGIPRTMGPEAFCFSFHEQAFDNGKLSCRAINGGTEIPVPKRFRHFDLSMAAESSSRIVFEKWEEDHGPWWVVLLTWWVPVPGYPLLPRQRVVFDLNSRKLISSWKPRIQNSNSPSVREWPYRSALSPDGELLAESGDGRLDLYRLAP